MEEKREIIQKKIYDEEGNLKYVIIPNYKKTKSLMTNQEIKFYKILILAINQIKNKNGLKLEVFPQVALNRIIEQNNRREKELQKDLFAKSIDYVLYNREIDEIFCCIELDGEEHQTNTERIKRDKIIDKMFEGNIKLIHQKVSNNYDLEEIINKIIN